MLSNSIRGFHKTGKDGKPSVHLDFRGIIWYNNYYIAKKSGVSK